MFDWDRFKKGEIAVHCDTEEKANDFLKKCDEKGIAWCTDIRATQDNNWAIYKENTAYCCMHSYERLEYASYVFYEGYNIEIIKWCDRTEKSFIEVISDIKEGEAWVQTEEGYVTERIYCIDGEIYLTLKQSRSSFGTSGKYKLERKEYTFEEAFKAYEEGKEIESCFSGQKFKIYSWEDIFNTKEIKEKWYIND